MTTLPILAQSPPIPDSPAKRAAYVKWGEIPLSFEPNVGQEPSEVRYIARGSSYTLYLAGAEVVLSGHKQAALRMRLVGANPAPPIVGESQQISTSNYLIGNDPSKWRTSVPNYGSARYHGVYPGIDLVFYGRDGTLEYDWVVAPSADPRRIRLGFDGADRVRVAEQGDLVIEAGQTEYRQKKPLVYQDVDGRRIEVAGAWRIHGKNAAFRIGRYDRTRPLIIDPALYYSTYLGGSASDYAYGIAVDDAGNTYVTGGTGSTNFPTTRPLSGSLRGSNDVFVTKISATGATKVYSTFLGSTGVDEGRGIAVDSRGAVYVTGSAGFSDFPMKNAIQGTWGGSGDAFLTKLDATGASLVYSTYLGGNGIDQGNAIALDPAGNAYVVGTTNSTNFPTVNPFQAGKGAQDDAFVAKINPAGSAWVYVTYLGGNNEDQGNGVAVDTNGNAYVTGYTVSTNFPVQSPFQSSNHGGVDGFVTKLNPAGSALVYSTYLGGSGNDNGNGIAVDASGNAVVTGVTASSDFPLANAIDGTLGSHAVDDVFVTKFNSSGSALVYSTYLGGGSEDDAYAIALDKAGDVFITGRTNSSDFPLVNPIQGVRTAFDMFVTEINPSGTSLLFSTFLGGSGEESGRSIAVDSLGNIHIAGETTSTDFPVAKAMQTGNGGVQDAIVLQFGTRVLSHFADFVGSGCSGGQFIYDPVSGQSNAALTNSNGTYTYVGHPLAAGFDTVRTGDFNGDGKADVILYNSSSGAASIGLGDGAGNFTFQSVSWSPGYDHVETGDLDGDGATDVVLYSSSTGFSVAGLSNGDGTFTYKSSFGVIGFPYVRLADFTGDGKADVFLYRPSDGLGLLGVSDGSGEFSFSYLFLSAGNDLIDAGDLNGDGRADLILYRSATGVAATGISDGGGGFAFTPQTFSPGYTSVRLADFTGDGLADVAVYNGNTGSFALGIGTGTGGFTFQAEQSLYQGLTVIPEDVNCDGKADLIVYDSNIGGEAYTALSNGDGTFSYVYSSWGRKQITVDQNHGLPLAVGPPVTVSLDRQALAFAATSNGSAFVLQTGSQGIALTQSAGLPISWTATSDKPWLVVTPTSGSQGATLTVSIVFDPTVAAAGSATGHIFVAVLGASNTLGPITVTLTTIGVGTSMPPFGSFDTPTNGSTGIAGSIPVTGWALDDVQVTRLTICRDSVTGETATPTGNCAGNAKIYIGDAVFVDGARPDVQGAYPTIPLNSRAGWGYLMLTNFLPNLGNGTFNLEAYAFDADGHTTLLGTKAITCANASSTAPFGAIDTPAQGAVVSGAAFANFGWVLAKAPNYADPPNGGTVQVFVDGTVVGSPAGWSSRADLTALFPSSSYPGVGAALGVYGLDTTTLANGVHTIFWIATGTGGGGTSGIGSRFITVLNSSETLDPTAGAAAAPSRSIVIASNPTLDTPRAAAVRVVSPQALEAEIAAAPIDVSSVQGRRGFDLDRALQTYTPSGGRLEVQAEELDRIELHLDSTVGHQFRGYLCTPAGLQPLPVGSSLDAATGTFTWAPGVGFYGAYDLTFVRWSNGRAATRQDVRITLNAKGSNRVGPQTIVDEPGEGRVFRTGQAFFVGGWAADLDSPVDSGVNAVHVWAYPIDTSGTALDPIFIGPAIYGGARPDVATVYGDRFGDSGFGIIVNGLAPGTYDIAVFAYSTVVNNFTPAKVVRVTVR